MAATAVAAVLLLSLGGLAGCKSSSSKADGGTGGYDRGPMLANIGEKVILPALRDAATAAAALEKAVAAYATARSKGAADTELDAARKAFVVAYLAWQRVEVMELGPAGTAGSAPGGKGLRDEIYSWTTVSPCYVDQQIVAKGYEASDFFSAKLVSAYGFDALEYLLYHDGADNKCPAPSAINRDGTWKAIPATELPLRRAAYAAVVAKNIVQRTAELRDAWEPAKGNFVAQLAKPGQGGSAYDTATAAVDALFAAIYYVELRTKDKKLALPTGVDPACTAGACPELVEAPFARVSADAIAANLESFRAVFTGGDGQGFDDYLKAASAGDLAQSIIKLCDAAIAKAKGLGKPLSEAVSSDLAKAREVHAAVKALTDLLKTQMVTVLSVRVPQEGAGDND